MFDIITSEELWELKPLVLDKTNFIDILLDYGIDVSEELYNSFKYKCSCPLPRHYGRGEGGEDRTPSFCVSDKNKFYCFGCHAHGNVIDFIGKMEGMPPIEVLRTLANKYGFIEDGSIKATGIKKKKKKKNPAIDDIVFNTYIIIRKYRESHDDYKWVEKLSSVAENLFNKLNFQEWEKALHIKKRVGEKIKERGTDI